MTLALVIVTLAAIGAGLFVWRERRVRRVSELEKRVKFLKKRLISLEMAVAGGVSADQLAELERKIDGLGSSTAPAVVQKVVAQQNQVTIDMIAMRKQLDEMHLAFKRYKNAATLAGINLEAGV